MAERTGAAAEPTANLFAPDVDHKPATVINTAKFANAPRPKGDRDMDDRPFRKNG